MTIEERNKLIEDNLKLAHDAANRYRNILPYAEIDDLVAKAQLVMVEATDKYNGRYKYTTFINTCVKNAFLVDRKANGCKFRGGGQKCQLSLDERLDREDGNSSTRHDVVGGLYDDDEAVEQVDRQYMISQMMKRLTAKELDAITKHCIEERPYAEIASEYGVKWQCVQQVVKHGLEKMARAGYRNSEYA